METFRDLVRLKMVVNHIEDLKELSRLTGIAYQTLRLKIRKPEQLRVFEIVALDEVLHFGDGELLTVLRGL